jgi:hypothetical protein
MRILLVSDKENEYFWDYFNPERFKGVELIISCGDMQASIRKYGTKKQYIFNLVIYPCKIR